MLTATLTHHLGWVSTVLNETNSSKSECNEAATEQRAKLLQISQTHPYNALWAQMGDLFGSIGVPPKLSRTIIYGTQKLPVERLLNILTFFIRCSEVRYTVKREIFSKQHINFIINQTHMDILKQHVMPKTNSIDLKNSNDLLQNIECDSKQNGKLIRSQTQNQTLSSLYNDELLNMKKNPNQNGYILDGNELVKNMKKNEIPNVLAFRDSRFVQQELRIGNFLMDTGIEKSAIIQPFFNTLPCEYQSDNERIRLKVTTPDNVEIYLENENLWNNYDENSIDTEGKALEAIEIDMPDTIGSPVKSIEKSCKYVRRKSKNFFWNMVPHALREGLCLNENSTSAHQQITHDIKENNNKKISHDFNDYTITNLTDEQTKLSQTLSFTSLSDLITQNSMGKSDRMTWGIEPTKENICLDEQMHFDLSKLIIEREHGMLIDSNNITNNTKINNKISDEHIEQSSNNESMKVLFVLGDNEPLVNLKRNNKDVEKITNNLQQYTNTLIEEEEQDDEEGGDDNKKQMLCSIHQRTHVAAQMSSKKHSGVKFNFEQYPQIATNYMKSKNLILSHYNLLIDKSLKLDDDSVGIMQNQMPTNIFPSVSGNNATDTDNNCITNNNCKICSSILKTYQTPSNATELEFETDQMHYSPIVQQQTISNDTNLTQYNMLHTVSSVTSVETLKSAEHHISSPTTTTSSTSTKSTVIDDEHTKVNNVDSKQNYDFEQYNMKAMKPINKIRCLQMPIPSIKEVRDETVDDSNIKMRTGFIPSMFLKFCDHYVSDMILQGTCAPPSQWENSLREDLALAARSGALISIPMENVAIIADMERWDVRFISSQAQCFPNTTDHSAPVGMSQLVSTMLETVHAMNNAGISAYDCLSYIESKLHEIYLHSESLATFLLETDFCPLSYITRALNISENDVPLLLSIASVHTPQISRKCGISFR